MLSDQWKLIKDFIDNPKKNLEKKYRQVSNIRRTLLAIKLSITQM